MCEKVALFLAQKTHIYWRVLTASLRTSHVPPPSRPVMLRLCRKQPIQVLSEQQRSLWTVTEIVFLAIDTMQQQVSAQRGRDSGIMSLVEKDKEALTVRKKVLLYGGPQTHQQADRQSNWMIALTG